MKPGAGVCDRAMQHSGLRLDSWSSILMLSSNCRHHAHPSAPCLFTSMPCEHSVLAAEPATLPGCPGKLFVFADATQLLMLCTGQQLQRGSPHASHSCSHYLTVVTCLHRHVPHSYYSVRWLSYYPLQWRLPGGWFTLGEALAGLAVLLAFAAGDYLGWNDTNMSGEAHSNPASVLGVPLAGTLVPH